MVLLNKKLKINRFKVNFNEQNFFLKKKKYKASDIFTKSKINKKRFCYK